MRAVVQRVRRAQVTVGDQTVGAIDQGLLVYLGAADGDADSDLHYVVDKVAGLRVFPDDDGKMSLAVGDIDGEVLVVSQFTLFGDVRRGRRPSFDGAAEPTTARVLYERALERFRLHHELPVASGRFRAHMIVSADVDGPVTILIDSRKVF